MNTWLLIGIFVVSAVVVWKAGVRLSSATEVLDRRFGLGQALGGLLLLTIATNLPEIAIVITAGVRGNIGLATGNLLGGVAIQTAVLVVLDAFGPAKKPLTVQSKSITSVLEAILVVAVLVLVIMGTQLNGTMVWRIEPIALLIAVVWFAGILFVRAARAGLPWRLDESEADDDDGQQDDEASEPQGNRALIVFGAAALLTLIGGTILELTGDALSTRFGMDGIVFGATVLAAATAIPEVSTGLQSVRMGQAELAISDIFGGNAFLATLFLLANLVSGQQVLASADSSEIYLAALGCILTAVYIVGLLWRSQRLTIRMGIDSTLVLILYIAGIAGLLLVS